MELIDDPPVKGMSPNITLEELTNIFMNMVDGDYFDNANTTDFLDTDMASLLKRHLRDDLENAIENSTWDDMKDITGRDIKLFLTSERVSSTWGKVLIVAYVCMILIGTFSNASILWACFASKMVCSARNIFIINMAISGIFLCTFTMPLTLIDLLHRYWTLGETRFFLCKTIGMMQSTCIFFSTYAVVLIAIDRYLFVIRPFKISISTVQALILSAASLILSFMISLPLFLKTDLVLYIKGIAYCEETWNSNEERLAYTGFCFSMQYIVPSIIVIIAYVCICLKYRESTRRANTAVSSHTRQRKLQRCCRTNKMLIIASVVFFFSWLPLNCFNITLIFFPDTFEDPQLMTLIYSVCHLTGMSTSFSNPVIYGFLNTNYSQAFRLLNCSGTEETFRSANQAREERANQQQTNMVRENGIEQQTNVIREERMFNRVRADMIEEQSNMVRENMMEQQSNVVRENGIDRQSSLIAGEEMINHQCNQPVRESIVQPTSQMINRQISQEKVGRQTSLCGQELNGQPFVISEDRNSQNREEEEPSQDQTQSDVRDSAV